MYKIPIGISDFRMIRTNPKLLYVDKTEFISEFLQDPSIVLLITRPRRFGKTLNLSTLRYFFDHQNAEVNRKLFEGLKVFANEDIMASQGTKPVIYLTLKDCKERNFPDLYIKIKQALCQSASLLTDLKSDCLEPVEWQQILGIKSMSLQPAELSNSLLLLAKACQHTYQQSPLILIDEYDVPLQSAWENGYYEEAIGFLRNFFSAAFKDNPYLWRGVMTGCLRVSKESIFTGLNNLKVAGVSSESYAGHFGLTEPEVKSLLDEFALKDKIELVEKWYNGYNFGGCVIYNPWSILNFLEQRGLFKAYWVNTSGNDMVYSLLRTSNVECKKNLEILMAGGTITAPLLEHTVFQLLEKDSDNLWNFLYFTGYLKAESIDYPEDGSSGPIATFQVPNLEVSTIFKQSVTYWFQDSKGYEQLKNLRTCLKNGDGAEFSKVFRKLSENSLSYFDVGKPEPERFYHAFTLGLIVTLSDFWLIRSNREAGMGRCDILMIPKNPEHFGVIMELKSMDSTEEPDLGHTAQKALMQIEEKQYSKELSSQGVSKIMLVGIGFWGKQVEILTKTADTDLSL
ncbi:MAG: AAA family ATPase [Candidatus Cloacimonetes bacterium]|nr:AAA family ATPase [Candidatus Cloacimonadota bacterium]